MSEPLVSSRLKIQSLLSHSSDLDKHVREIVSVMLLFSMFFSGGVMIYFDRIEVVNYLIPSAGKLTSLQQAKNM